MLMIKKTIFTLLALLVLFTPITDTFASTLNKLNFPDKEIFNRLINLEEEQHFIPLDDGIYTVNKYKENDGSVKVDVVSPEDEIERFKIVDNIVYDENDEVVATVEEKFIAFDDQVQSSRDDEIQLMSYPSYHESTTSPYASSQYSKYVGTTYDNIHFKKNIQTLTTAALALFVSIVAPPLATPFAVMLIPIAITKNINAHSIFYRKIQWNHQHLGSLAQEIYVSMYWDPGYKSPAGTTRVYYRIFG